MCYKKWFNQIVLLPNFRVALFNICCVPLVVLRVYLRFFLVVLFFGSEFTNDLAHVCIYFIEENLDNIPLSCLSVDPDVAIFLGFPDLWYHAAKPFKNWKVTLYDTALALECIKYFSAQGYILSTFVALCVTAFFRIIQSISRSNTPIIVGLLGERVRAVIHLFAIFLL